jgi:integrase
MPPSALEIVRERSSGDPQAYVFPTEKGTKMKYLSKTFKKVLKDLGINNGVEDSRFRLGFHSLRHTFATEVLASGDVNIVDLQHMLGHKNVTTTQRYTHPAKKAMIAAANHMEKKLGAAKA